MMTKRVKSEQPAIDMKLAGSSLFNPTKRVDCAPDQR
jgi:hypothetical protein